MGKINRFTIFVLCSLFFILCFLIYLWQGIYLPKNSSGLEEVFSIKRGESVKEIAYNLENQDLVRNKIFFIFYIFLAGDSKRIQAGEYFLSSSESMNKIAQKFVSGDVAKITVTIPEGFTVRQIEEKMELKLPGENLEGFLFPDTYQFPVGVGGEEVVRKMRDNFDRKLSPGLREEINKQGKTIFEIVSMASLLEKEVKSFEDKKLVSGILWKRLENGIPLQVDATIVYITGKKTTNISKEDLQIDSPYNTYKYRGLPFGPICNPGLDSILAAIYPKDSEFWYYLSSLDGETIFSRTLEEHNIARAKHLPK